MSIVVCLSAGIMLVLNIIKHSDTMAITSIILIISFLITGLIAGVFKKDKVSSVLMALVLTVVFTFFIVNGGNEGFATLWVLLIPLFSISLFGIYIGLGMNVYFSAFLLCLFYTPLSTMVEDLYTENFINRFPVLFIADAFSAQFLSLSSEYYYRKLHMQIYTDEMTQTFNRKYFIEFLSNKESELLDNLCIVAIDVNGLKEINDSLGHLAGDELICTIPLFAKRAFGEDVTIARIGGDEFILLVNEDKEDVLSKVRLMKEYALDYKSKLLNRVYFSAGVAYRKDYVKITLENLYQCADKLMYEDKEKFYLDTAKDRRKR